MSHHRDFQGKDFQGWDFQRAYGGWGEQMKRKIIQHGPSTLIISLPSTWVKQNGIKKGDELDVKEEGKTLIVGAVKANTQFLLSEDISKFKPFLVTRLLVRAYQKGYDRVHLTHNDVDLLKTIQEKILELIGFEIIEQNSKTCLIQSISSNIELDFENSLRKAFLITKQMIETVSEAYSQGDTATLSSLYLKDIEVNRFTYFCLRQINKEQYANAERSQQSHILYHLIELLENLGDTISQYLSVQLSKAPKKNRDIMVLLKLLVEYYEVSYGYFYKPSVEKVNQAYALYGEISKKIEAFVSSPSNPIEIMSIIHIKEASRLIYYFTTMRLDFLKESKLPPAY